MMLSGGFMKKKISAILILFMIIPVSLFAEYSILVPRPGDNTFIVADKDGDTMPLDDYIYYKSWHNLLLQNMGDNIYMITEDDDNVLVIGENASPRDVEFAARFNDISTIINIGQLLPEDIIEDLDDGDMLMTSRYDKLYEVLLERYDLDAYTIRRGDRIMIDDGEYVPSHEGKEVYVSCPHCGHSFRIYI